MKNLIPENHLHPDEARWFAVYTRFQREKLIQKQLASKGIEAYVPLITLTRQYRRKKRVVNLPLISGYVFVRIIRRDYVRVLETQDVVKFVQFSRNLIAIPDREIEIMKRVVGEGIEVEAEPARLHIGDNVEIARGGLAGITGKLVACGQKNFVIELNNVGYSLRMQVHPNDLVSAEVAC